MLACPWYPNEKFGIVPLPVNPAQTKLIRRLAGQAEKHCPLVD
jgi:hypothetical protein